MRTIFYRLWGVPRVALKRLWAHKMMTAITIFGLTAAIALFMTVPMFSDGVNFRILERRLANQTENRRRPPFAYLFSYIGSWHGPLQWQAIAEADAYMAGNGGRSLGLEPISITRHVESPLYAIFTTTQSDYEDTSVALGFMQFGHTTGMEEHIKLVEGQLPAPAGPDDPLEVIVSAAWANEFGWQIGERYVTYDHRNESPDTFEVIITGIWEPLDPAEEYWPYNTSAYDELLIVPEASFINHIAPAINDEVNLISWYLNMDGSEVQPGDAERLISSLRRVERELGNLLPDTETFVTPTDALELYRNDVNRLNQTLLIYNIPTIGLVLAFIGLVGSLVADQRRNELAVMRSRGAPVAQLTASILIEALFIGLISFGLGILVSMLLTSWMGTVRSFLDFSADSSIRVIVGPEALRAGLIAAVIAVLAQLIPTFSTIQYTVVSYKLTQSREARPPWWQRAYIDLLLAAIAIYGYYQLVGQGSILTITGEAGGDPFQNPILFLLPAFIIFAVTLLSLRILPWLMNGVAWLLQFSDSIATLQAARYLARSPRMYTTPLILLVLTVSFAIYTASLAQTLDFQIYDAQFYRTGADINLFNAPVAQSAGSFGITISNDPADFLFLPMTEYESIEGIKSATRVGVYQANGQIGTTDLPGIFYGIDWFDFPETAYWRWDFSNYRLGSLMNALGDNADGLLVPETVLTSYGVRVGDPIRIDVSALGEDIEFQGRIVGTFKAFPTWYDSEDGFLFVANLEEFYRQAGNAFPYRVWMNKDAPLTDFELRRALERKGLLNSSWTGPERAITASLERPERHGLFGLLSVGFIAATVLTILGLFLYALFSYRRRVVELGILRAVGLSTGQMTRLIAWELALLVAVGLSLGTILGIGVSELFIPFLQTGSEPIDLVPTLLVEVSWAAISQVYLLYGLLFVLALISLVLIAARMRIFMAIKLGETV